MFGGYKFFFIIIFFFLFGAIQNVKAQKHFSAQLSEANKLIYSNPEKAIELADEVYRGSPENSNLQLSSLIALGTAYSEKFDMDKSIESLLKAYEIARLKNDYINQVRALSLLGYQYQILQINDKTHSYLDQAEAIISRHPLPDSLLYLQGNNYSIKALTYQETLDCDYAVEYFNKAISVYKKLKYNDVSKTNLCIGYINKSSCFLEIGNTDSAKISLLNADMILDKMDMPDDIETSQQISWAKYYFLTKDYSKSIRILNENLEKAKKMSQIGVDTDIYELLSKNYLALNDMENYSRFSNLYVETQKKLSDAEKKSIIHIINKPPESNQEEHSFFSDKKLYIVVFFLTIIIIFIALFSIKSYRLKHKMNRLKSNQDTES